MSHPLPEQTLAGLQAYLSARLDAVDAAARAAHRQQSHAAERLAALEAEVRSLGRWARAGADRSLHAQAPASGPCKVSPIEPDANGGRPHPGDRDAGCGVGPDTPSAGSQIFLRDSPKARYLDDIQRVPENLSPLERAASRGAPSAITQEPSDFRREGNLGSWDDLRLTKGANATESAELLAGADRSSRPLPELQRRMRREWAPRARVLTRGRARARDGGPQADTKSIAESALRI